MKYAILPVLSLLASLLLSGCDNDTDPQTTGPATASRADNCHVCGMIVLDQQGPKGQVRVNNTPKPLHFCSTSDMMAFLFQPETRAIVREAWVHNMHGVDWRQPPEDAFIDAFSAYYVVDHSRRGAMGHTLAPFAEQAQAEAFIADYGGRILRYEEIDVDLIAGMASYAFPDFDTVRDFDPEVELGGGK